MTKVIEVSWNLDVSLDLKVFVCVEDKLEAGFPEIAPILA